MTITIYDPAYKGRRLTKHEDLAPDVARELVKVYKALGYPRGCILVETQQIEKVAA
jgi:hypothetical protein